MKTKDKQTDILLGGAIIAGGLALAAFGFLMYCVATSAPDTQMVVDESGKLLEVELET